jgi:hypothetical protein
MQIQNIRRIKNFRRVKTLVWVMNLKDKEHPKG